MEERAERQATMRDRLAAEEGQRDLLTLAEVAKELNVSRSTAWRLLKNEMGVNLIRTPGSKRPIIRVDRSVIGRILRRTAN
jgi:hypothetical protein